MVADNRGLIAAVDSYGRAQSVYNYQSVDREEAQQLINVQALRQQRRPEMMSSGQHLVLAPQDHPGLIILHEGTMQVYTGPGASDRPTAIDGSELLLVGQQISLLDLDQRVARWSKPSGSNSHDGDGLIGTDTCWAQSGTDLIRIDRTSGEHLQRLPSPGQGLITVNDIIISAPAPHIKERQRSLTGLIDHQSGDQLMADLSKRQDPAAMLTLAALSRARGTKKKPSIIYY